MSAATLDDLERMLRALNGQPTAGTRCPEHRGYDRRWRVLSERARKLQPWCSDCGATEDLQADHSPEAA